MVLVSCERFCHTNSNLVSANQSADGKHYLKVELHVERLPISDLVLFDQIEEYILVDWTVVEDGLSSVDAAGSIEGRHALGRRSLDHGGH